LILFAMAILHTRAHMQKQVLLYDDSLTGWVNDLERPMVAFQDPKL